jgi:hypothetical protein
MTTPATTPPSITDPSLIFLILQARSTSPGTIPSPSLADTHLVRLGSTHREDPASTCYVSTLITASDGFELGVKMAYAKAAGHTVDIAGVTGTRKEAREFLWDSVESRVVQDGQEKKGVQEGQDEVSYSVMEWCKTGAGMQEKKSVRCVWSIVEVKLTQSDRSGGKSYALRDPASQPERAAYMERAEAEARGEVSPEEVMRRHGDMGHIVRRRSDDGDSDELE